MMRCHKCGGNYRSVKGPLGIQDPYVGYFEVEVPEYLRCDSCGEYLVSGKWAEEIDRARSRRLVELLEAMPLREFVSSSEAARLLGISRQALHKNRRIRNGFIFHIPFGKGVVYLRKSVELFKEKGDGRFPLWRPVSQIDTAEYIVLQSAPSSEFSQGLKPTSTSALANEYLPSKDTKLKELDEVFAHRCETLRPEAEVIYA